MQPRQDPQPRSRRRDRHGRGGRGRLVPPQLPGWRSRAEVFDDEVLRAVAEVTRGLGDSLADLEVVVQDVPPGSEASEVPLASTHPGTPPRLVVYRRPVELRAEDRLDLQDLLHEVVVDGLAELLGVDPEDLDPGQG